MCILFFTYLINFNKVGSMVLVIYNIEVIYYIREEIETFCCLFIFYKLSGSCIFYLWLNNHVATLSQWRKLLKITLFIKLKQEYEAYILFL